ncbi:MAG: sigma-70 family RNA polymerase sigma factor, partial [Candidatus Omnitrophica bacterium]|nr:sigma-70 family RNA polymerase sigma factor [Candidatus Omnitrophota bacterium]
MNFETLLKKISPKLKKIAGNRSSRGFFIDEEDLFQEMCCYLWIKFKEGIPLNINESYIIKGCDFHILNYLRTKREKARFLSFEQPIDDENGYTLKDVLADKGEPLDVSLDRKLTIEHIKNNGFSNREKEVFSLLLEGYTTREAGRKLGISHVMIIK